MGKTEALMRDMEVEINRLRGLVQRAEKHIRDLSYKLGADDDEVDAAVAYLKK